MLGCLQSQGCHDLFEKKSTHDFDTSSFEHVGGEYIGNFESCWAETCDLSGAQSNQGRCISTDSDILSVLTLHSWFSEFKGSFSFNYNWDRFKPWVSAATSAQHPDGTYKSNWNGIFSGEAEEIQQPWAPLKSQVFSYLSFLPNYDPTTFCLSNL